MPNPAVFHVLQFFEYAHLPPALQAISAPFLALADQVAASSDNPETTVALRKLLEAKDAAVRAVLVPAAPKKPSIDVFDTVEDRDPCPPWPPKPSRSPPCPRCGQILSENSKYACVAPECPLGLGRRP